MFLFIYLTRFEGDIIYNELVVANKVIWGVYIVRNSDIKRPAEKIAHTKITRYIFAPFLRIFVI